MKTTSKKPVAIVSAALTAALLVALTAAFTVTEQGYGVQPRTDQPNQETTKPAEGQPARYNKASGIIGMEVHNLQGERLGEVRDVVFDLASERVAYAVMNTGSTLLGRSKLLAVPLNAFTASADQKHLILRAEKAKVESAQGLERDNWPAVTNPSWGAQPFWEKTTPAKSETDDPGKPTANPKEQ
jgi:sporulation protein YlmC with PRC-barrel domain